MINADHCMAVFTFSVSLYNDKLRLWPDHVIELLNSMDLDGLVINYTHTQGHEL